jgi:pimeloyl-ACP methyl ester carboxylesterase
MSVYRDRQHHHQHQIEARGLSLSVNTYGQPDRPPLVLIHGWMDCADSWQFVLEELQQDWYVIAPDQRGFGRSEWQDGGYWFPDYLADLEVILDQLVGDQPVNLVGHSLGGNVASLYAGVRPDRVRRLVSVEGFGLPFIEADDAPARYGKWLDQLKKPPTLRDYDDFDALAARLKRNNPFLSADRATRLAQAWGQEINGRVIIRGDSAHKLTYPVLYRLEEAKACWRNVTAPTLWIAGKQSLWAKMFKSDDFSERKDCFQQFDEAWIDQAGHMIHHDQPAELAALIESHCRA